MLSTESSISRHVTFQGLAGSFWFWVTILLCLAAGCMIVMLLSYERKLVTAKVGNALLCLRLAVIAVILLTFLQPVAIWVTRRDTGGRIVVAVDVSRSMETSDTYAGNGELLRWARALEMIGNPVIDGRIDDWVAAYERGEEPQWVDPSEAAAAGRRAELADIRRQNVNEVIEAVRSMPRRQVAERLINGTRSPLLEQLQTVGDVEVQVFASRSETIDSAALQAVMEQQSATLRTGATDITASALKNTVQADSKVMGVIVFSDGQHNTGADPVEAAARLGTLGTPVYPVIIGSEERPRDIAVVSLDYPQVVFQNDTPLLKARIAADGFRDTEIQVHLEDEDGSTETTTVVVPSAGTGPPIVDVEIPLTADQPGRKEYTLRTDVRPAETRGDNNQRSFSISIVEDKSHVLLVDGAARWEFRFIDNALSRDERIQMSHVLFEQPFLGVLPQPFFPGQIDLPDDPADLTDSPFGMADLVLIGDVTPERFPEEAWQAVETFVRDEGGTLVLMAGKNHFPARHDFDSVRRLIPMRNLRVTNLTANQAELSPVERGFHLQLTPEGERLAMFQFDTDQRVNRSVWKNLPGHFWGLLGEARPGVTVYATARRREAATLQEERKNAVIAHQYYGFGQVLWVGIDSTWRWRHRVGDQYHHRFWGQLARWATENKASAGNEFVRINLLAEQIEAGADGIVQARWKKQYLDQNPGLAAWVEVLRQPEGGTAVPFSRARMQPVDGQALISRARLTGLPPGTWRVRLTVDNAETDLEDISTLLYVTDSHTTELSELAANHDLLSQIAEASGGVLITPDRVQELVELLQPPDGDVRSQSETTLWDHWVVLLGFFALLTTEWTIRKFNGLP